ncbi:dTDP-4-dehydrorhamnose 3,5-epimerase [Kibdelosporangium banguiense]|uniref:dTDP-4-dehydrorhamnose 3,5-epimerase n=1 Tax=Kibdelosporangium banguiense TaxID=1365924 RepID=A0ABS4TW94_9PSEU|nr:dTDP-4-dehydrorhamnose 3,5-epimerase family protein [Kibdelosporangium banguiense]MBP2328671.1 dTDP-4-dehydrorhamnose 3,5-epimerase [Kibdelosporangium banguiense]
MKVRELAVPGALEFTPDVHADHRGRFLELLRAEWWHEAIGRALPVAQVNCSVNHRGVVRGVHFTGLPGQAKFVTCLAGALVDVIVDTRAGSPSFGVHDTVLLDENTHKIVFLPEGVGHGIASLADGTTAFYLCSDTYDPANEFGVHPLDEDLGIDWRGLLAGSEPILSTRDSTAPAVAAARRAGLFPAYTKCLRLYQEGPS